MSKRFMNSNTFNNNEGAASWSDTDGFYKRVSWLATEAHTASNDDQDIQDYFMCLEQLHIEIEGAVKTESDRELLETERKKVYKELINGNLTKAGLKLLYKRNVVAKYHRALNKAAHKYGLYLRKSITAGLDSWDNE